MTKKNPYLEEPTATAVGEYLENLQETMLGLINYPVSLVVQTSYPFAAAVLEGLQANGSLTAVEGLGWELAAFLDTRLRPADELGSDGMSSIDDMFDEFGSFVGGEDDAGDDRPAVFTHHTRAILGAIFDREYDEAASLLNLGALDASAQLGKESGETYPPILSAAVLVAHILSNYNGALADAHEAGGIG